MEADTHQTHRRTAGAVPRGPWARRASSASPRSAKSATSLTTGWSRTTGRTSSRTKVRSRTFHQERMTTSPPPRTGPLRRANRARQLTCRWTRVHPPGSQHSSSLGLLPHIGGSYIVYDPVSRAVRLCGLAGFPVSGGTNSVPLMRRPARFSWRYSTPGGPFTPAIYCTYSTLTDSLSSVFGWNKSNRPTTARASLSDKFSPIWLAVRTIVGKGDDPRHPSTATVD